MKMGEAVQKAAIDNGINGVMEMSKHCGLSYERTVRVWKGDTSAKFADVFTILDSLGKKLAIEDKGE